MSIVDFGRPIGRLDKTDSRHRFTPSREGPIAAAVLKKTNILTYNAALPDKITIRCITGNEHLMLPREEAVPITATGVDFLSAFDIAEVTVDALNHPEVVGFAKIALHLFANNYETICHALDPDTTIAGIFRPYSNVTTPEYAMTLPKWFSPRLNGEGAILMTGKPLGAGEFNTKGQKVIGLFAQLGLTIPPEDSIWLSWFRLWDDGAAHQATFGIPFPLLTAYKQQKMGQ